MTPHTTRIVVWDVPSAVTVGDKFRLKVGLKCSSACRLEGRGFTICDSAGTRLAAGTVGGDTWQGSTSLFFGEVEVDAPLTEGHHVWEVRAPLWNAKVQESDLEISHEERSNSFEVRSVLPADSLVRVEVVGKDEGALLSGASVVIYPYRAVTDDRGVAEIRVTKGRYRLQVSQSNYFASNRSIVVTGDVLARVELDPEPVQNPDDRYVW